MKNRNKNKCHSKPRPLPFGRAPEGLYPGSNYNDLESHRFLKRQQGEMLNQVQHNIFFYNKAFTLIELLVVVLIIGILAAVAVPQYQQAVDKSRVMPYIQLVKEILKAENLYFTANGEYTSDLQALDIDVSKACPVQFGGELRNCAGGFAFNIPSQYNTIVKNEIILYYCRDTESCNYNENRHFVAVFPFNGFTPACGHNTSRGKHLCTWITSQF